jgi:RND superfamily putative drug exporter
MRTSDGKGALSRWGGFVYDHPLPVIGLSALLLVTSVVALLEGGHLAGNFAPSGQALQASRLIEQGLPQPGHTSFQLIFSSDRLTALDPAFQKAVGDALQPLTHNPRVTGIETPYTGTGISDASALVSTDGHRVLTTVYLRDDFKAATMYYPQLRAAVHSETLRVQATGDIAVSRDLDLALDRDLGRAELTSFPIALLLLVIVFGSLVSSLLPIGIGALTIVGGSAGVLLMARATDVSDVTTDLIILLGLGLAIDYSLFVISRFREELAAGRDTRQALTVVLATAGRAIVFSALTVGISLSGLLFYQGTFLPALGVAAALTVGLGIVYGLTLLPAVLSLLGPKVNWLRVRPLHPARDTAGWSALAHLVMRRPIVMGVPALFLLLVVGSPFLQLRFESNDLNFLPADAEARQAHSLLVSSFPAQSDAEIAVVVQYPSGRPLSASRVGDLYDLSRSIGRRRDVRAVRSVVDLDPTLTRAGYQALYSQASLSGPVADAVRQTVGRDFVVMDVTSRYQDGSDQVRALVRSLRSQSVLGARVLVTGTTAFNLDVIDLIQQQTPAAIAFVVGATVLVLYVMLRSLVLPLEAVAFTLLSITVSFGAMVWVFQQGHLSGLLGFTPSPIDPALPVLLFCIVFGLSMDYEVLLLSRIKEAYAEGRDNQAAIAEGMQRSGPVITSAALIAVAVFGAFTVGQVVLVKAVGLGLALAVAIDATVVRMVAVPALMRVIGELNWWAPRWMSPGSAAHQPGRTSEETGTEMP